MHEKQEIDIEELSKVFRLNNGKLERSYKRGGRWHEVSSKPLGTCNYCKVKYNGGMSRYHIIVYMLHTNKPIPLGLDIDHINGNTTDNRVENLRLVTNRQNCQNRQIHRDGRITGYIYDKGRNLYCCQIIIHNKRIHIGRYKNKITSHKAYMIACSHVDEYKDNASFRNMVNEQLYKGGK